LVDLHLTKIVFSVLNLCIFDVLDGVSLKNAALSHAGFTEMSMTVLDWKIHQVAITQPPLQSSASRYTTNPVREE
jgi:hypothetical protein